MSRPASRREASARLFEAALDVMRRAYAPYSTFPVGAAILTESGAIYVGCNVENASYPEGWCAETSAIAQMVAAGERKISEVAVVAEKLRATLPCGGCRQRLSEFGSEETLVHLCDLGGIVETVALGALLPRSFVLPR
jgi:cytidine deaminase